MAVEVLWSVSHCFRRNGCVSQAQKKRAGTRVAELESKLGKVQDELKKLREQLASAEVAKKDAQVALEEAKKRVGGAKGSPASGSTSLRAFPSARAGVESKKAVKVKVAPEPAEDESSMNSQATDVFEVVPTESVDKENQRAAAAEECEAVSKAALAEKEVEEEETKKMIDEESNAAIVETDGEKESPEVTELKAKLAEIAALTAENAELKKQAEEAAWKEEEGAAAKASLVEQSLKDGAAREARLGEQLKASEAAREALETEMRRLRVQTEQWRKAAEAAAAVLGGDNHLAGLHGIARGGNGWGSPATMPDDGDDDFGSKRKGAGMRMLGDLWKKKGNKA
jgi:outer membrane murein-binding lipoprotein Lpp